jgi:hypothetical protein
MKRFMVLLVVVVACIAGLGFYRGWFHVGSDASEDKRSVTFTADPNKIKDDEKKVVEKVKDLGNQAKGKVAAPTEKTKDETASTAQRPESSE